MAQDRKALIVVPVQSPNAIEMLCRPIDIFLILYAQHINPDERIHLLRKARIDTKIKYVF